MCIHNAMTTHACFDCNTLYTLTRMYVHILGLPYTFMNAHIHICIHTQDFDECANSGINPCDHECHNTPGSFTCSCRDGWYIDAGGTRCFGTLCLINITLVSEKK